MCRASRPGQHCAHFDALDLSRRVAQATPADRPEAPTPAELLAYATGFDLLAHLAPDGRVMVAHPVTRDQVEVREYADVALLGGELARMRRR